MKDVLKQIIRNFHAVGIPALYSRELKVPLHTRKVISVIGARRCGKTYVLFQAVRDLLKEGIDITKILYLNFEDERLNLTVNDLDLILQAYRELYPDNKIYGCYFFFDEIQNVQGWEKFVRRVYDSVTPHIFITGSNSRLLGKEIATSLRGRTLQYELYPLSFMEYLQFKSIANDYYNDECKARMNNAFHDYMTNGGYPETLALGKPERERLLQEYFNVMIYRDVAERYQVHDIILLKYFIKKIFNGITKPLSVNKIYNELRSEKYSVGKNYLYQYLEYFESCYFVMALKKFDYSEIKTENAEKKAYVIDNGLLSAINLSYSDDYGKLFENLVFLELLKQGHKMHYYKDKHECDFIVGDRNPIPVQACYDVSEKDTREREVSSLLAACKFIRAKRGIVLTRDYSESLKIGNVSVEFIPAVKYFTA